MKCHSTLGCCGLDCGLCPRYYAEGYSKCPGCYGADFDAKHPSCGYITCCFKKKNLEVCAKCDEFPSSRSQSWLYKDVIYDSFLTHQKIADNLMFIKTHGIDKFIKQQLKRIKLLEKMLDYSDDGRSKSFYCLATTLLPLDKSEKSLKEARLKIADIKVEQKDLKTRANILKEILNHYASKEGIELKLMRSKGGKK